MKFSLTEASVRVNAVPHLDTPENVVCVVDVISVPGVVGVVGVVDVCVCVYVCMDGCVYVCEWLWVCVSVGSMLICWDICRSVGTPTDMHRSLPICVNPCRSVGIHVHMHGYQ
jgi:hypothetical protein